MQPFPISLSVGTQCSAKCPYCDIRKLKQNIATGKDLIMAGEAIIRELNHSYKTFWIRVTGGEIGEVPGLKEFIDWVNQTQNIIFARIYTKGDLFNVSNIDLSRKCKVYEHFIHDARGSKLIRYDQFNAPSTVNEITEIIESRRQRCLAYRAVMVDTGRIDPQMREALQKSGIKFSQEISRLKSSCYPRDPSKISEKNKACFNSQALYVFDVANQLYFHCCQVKDPKQGKAHNNLLEFLKSNPGEPYVQCETCNFPSTYPPPSHISEIDTARKDVQL